MPRKNVLIALLTLALSGAALPARSESPEDPIAELRKCPGCNLVGGNLSRRSFAGGNFEGADLSRANLSESDFSGALLAGANLTDADLRETNLSGADLRSATLRGAYVVGARFDGAIFGNTVLPGGQVCSSGCESLLGEP